LISHWLFCSVVALPSAALCQEDMSLLANQINLPALSKYIQQLLALV